jgi:hypothetical protein
MASPAQQASARGRHASRDASATTWLRAAAIALIDAIVAVIAAILAAAALPALLMLFELLAPRHMGIG